MECGEGDVAGGEVGDEDEIGDVVGFEGGGEGADEAVVEGFAFGFELAQVALLVGEEGAEVFDMLVEFGFWEVAGGGAADFALGHPE